MSEISSPLLTLPAEIRNIIWSEVLVEPEPIPLGWLLAKAPFALDRVALWVRVEPGLLAACHAIRAEATAMFYANNVFKLRSVYSMFRLVRQVRWKGSAIAEVMGSFVYFWHCGGHQDGAPVRNWGFCSDVGGKRSAGEIKTKEFEKRDGFTMTYCTMGGCMTLRPLYIRTSGCPEVSL